MMFDYFKRIRKDASSSRTPNVTTGSNNSVESTPMDTTQDGASGSTPPPSSDLSSQLEFRSNKVMRTRIEVDLNNLPSDPGLRVPISAYDPNDQESVRRAYLQRGPCQLSVEYPYPETQIGGRPRSFNPNLYQTYANWLEYSKTKDALFCLPCYLFRPQSGKGSSADAFTIEGFKNWKGTKRIKSHVGKHNSSHNEACRRCENLMKQNRHIDTLVTNFSNQDRIDYRKRLDASVDVVRFLLRQGIAFRGHDKSESSINRGNFLELLHFLATHNKSVDNVVLKNAPENLRLTSPDIQKDIVNSAAVETVNAIISDLGDDLFAVLVDESRDISIKEQMAVILRYVNKQGCVIERFVGIIHVPNTSALSLKASLEDFFGKFNLSIMRLRGQGYDGASNMQGRFNGLKSLILKENKSAFYVHCFAHQLQLALVHVVTDIPENSSFFTSVANVVNTTGASCKRRDKLREEEIERIAEQLESGELSRGKGKNQETSMKRACDTRWSSHYGTLVNLVTMFSSVINVLEDVVEDGSRTNQKGDASSLLGLMRTFELIFILHLMKKVLAITNDLSKALQKDDQDIVNTMTLVKISKERLQLLRDSGWDSLYGDVCSFCEKYGVCIPNMDDKFVPRNRSHRKAGMTTVRQYYQFYLFIGCIDKQRVELDDRFNEVNTELLLCIASLNPSASFAAFSVEKLVRLSEFYPEDFSEQERIDLHNQLETYEMDVKFNNDFSNVKNINQLAQKMVEVRKHVTYNLVYRLIKLALILPAATATVERSFSAMNIVKNRLRNRMGDEWLNDCLVTYIEKDVFDCIANMSIMMRFQKMKPRRGQL